jgi:hypothetical protein
MIVCMARVCEQRDCWTIRRVEIRPVIGRFRIGLAGRVRFSGRLLVVGWLLRLRNHVVTAGQNVVQLH